MKALASAVLVLCILFAQQAVAAEKPARGIIEVATPAASSPAHVYIEGVAVGQTPVQIPEMLVRTYRVVVKQDRHDDFIQDVKVMDGQTTQVEASLTPSSGGLHAPVRADADWTPIQDKDKGRYEKAKSTVRLRDYKVLEISNFLVKSDEPIPAEHLYSLVPDVVSELDKQAQFAKFATVYTKDPSPKWVRSADADNVPTLVLSGVINRYLPGSRATRYLVGFGAGKTRIYSVFRLVDKATGKVVFERMENGSVSMGLLGGDSKGVFQELASDIAKAIKQNW